MNEKGVLKLCFIFMVLVVISTVALPFVSGMMFNTIVCLVVIFGLCELFTGVIYIMKILEK